MLKAKRTRQIVAGYLLGFFIASAGGQTADGIELGRRYVDPLHGFSLRPPAGVERKRGFSAAMLVSWSGRDPNTGAVAWTLSVHRAVESNEKIDLEPYASALAEKLRRDEKFKSESIELAPVAGKAAIHFKGVTTGALKWWQWQVWVLARPGEFFVFKMTGPANAKDRLRAIFQEVLGTLQITDPKAALNERKDNLQRGRKFLAGLTDEKIAKAVRAEPKWYLLRLKDEEVGFMRVVASNARRDGASGVLVKTWVRLSVPNDRVRLLSREMFAATDRSLERWTNRLRIGTGTQATMVKEEGIKQAELIVCSVTGPDGARTFKKKVPGSIYLPRALGQLLPRLIDLKTPAGYAFATYTSVANSFDMRTFTVLGPDHITVGSRDAEAVKVTDQAAADAEAATLWLNADGNLLKMQTAEGMTMVPATYTAVLRRFPKAVVAVKALGK